MNLAGNFPPLMYLCPNKPEMDLQPLTLRPKVGEGSDRSNEENKREDLVYWGTGPGELGSKAGTP